MTRPDTTMGRALAGRSLHLVERHGSRARPQVAPIDMTTPEAHRAPEHVRDAAKAALDRGETHYTVRPGVPELRAAIARHSTEDGFPATVDGTVITNGGAEALYIALQSTLRPADTALIGCPLAPNVVEMIEFIGARIERLPLDPQRFAPSVHDIERTGGTVLLLASPSPVTGLTLPVDDLARLVATALDRGLDVILDRTTAWCAYDTAPEPFPDPELGARVLTTGSFSTAYALAGWRVGYFTAPADHISSMRELKQAMSICTSAVSQFAALAALAGLPEWLDQRRALMLGHRDAVLDALAAHGLSAVQTDAWPALLLDTRRIDADDEAVAARLAAEAGIIVEPASRYGEALRGHVRIDLSVPQPTFDAFLERLTQDTPLLTGEGQGVR